MLLSECHPLRPVNPINTSFSFSFFFKIFNDTVLPIAGNQQRDGTEIHCCHVYSVHSRGLCVLPTRPDYDEKVNFRTNSVFFAPVFCPGKREVKYRITRVKIVVNIIAHLRHGKVTFAANMQKTCQIYLTDAINFYIIQF